MEGVSEELVDIPLEYFETAISWMKSQITVNPDKLVITGGSRGGELSLLLGAKFSDFKVVVARVPSNVVWGGVTQERRTCPSWVHKGKPLPYVFSIFTAPDILDLELQGRAGVPYRLTPIFLRAMQNKESMEKAAIPVEKISGPVLLISGQDDQMWPSSIFADLVMKRLDEKGFAYPYEHLCYSGAGHMITYPYLPMTFTISKHPVTGKSYSLGGTTIDTAFACSDSWNKTLEFLEKHLK
jgi:dienelactone hydrolase